MLFLRKGKPLLVSDNVSLELDWYQGDTQTNYAQTNMHKKCTKTNKYA